MVNKKLSVIVADDHPLFRAGVINILKEKDYVIIGEASDGEETLKLLKSVKPSILILDMDMPRFNGLQVLEQINNISPKTKTVFLTMYKEEKLFNRVMDFGVSGYLLKDSAIAEIIDCLEAVNGNNYYISPVLSSYFVNRIKIKKLITDENEELENLTATEIKVLKLISLSKSSKQIGEELFISSRTVDKHRENICKKLNIHGSLNLMKFAIDNRHAL